MGPQNCCRDPSQKDLAKRIRTSEAAVSRCFNDPSARELRLYWKTAVDLTAVMKWSKPSVGKTTR